MTVIDPAAAPDDLADVSLERIATVMAATGRREATADD